MAYADQKMSGGRVVAIVIVVLIHAVLGYAFVTGLAYQYVKKAQEKLNTFDVEEPPPPPPDEPPPPPPDTPMTPPPVVSPPPIVQNPNPPPVVIQTVSTPPPSVNLTPIAAPPMPPAPPAAAPAPPRISQAAKSKGDPRSWYSTDDYPAGALRAQAAGRVVARLSIGADGRVSGCTVSSSSGNSELDRATCQVAQRRGRYTPAKDENGAPIAASDTISIRWQVPDE
jgi:protein TonB